MSLSTSSLAFDTSGISYATAPAPRRGSSDGDNFANYFANFSTAAAPAVPPKPQPDHRDLRADGMDLAGDASSRNGDQTESPESLNSSSEDSASGPAAPETAAREKSDSDVEQKTSNPASGREGRSKSLATRRSGESPAAVALSALNFLPGPAGPTTGFQSQLKGEASPGTPAITPIKPALPDLGSPLSLGDSSSANLSTVPANPSPAFDTTATSPTVPETGTAPDFAALSTAALLPAANAVNAPVGPEKPAAEKNSAFPKITAKKLEKQFGAGAEKFLSDEKQGLTEAEAAVGIGTAKPVVEMATVQKFHDGAFRDAGLMTAAAEIASSPNSAQDFSGRDGVAASVQEVAQRAVEAVMSVADLAATRQQHAVNLQFSVNGTPLEVRVEMKAGDVHTTFRTDSSELRAALADAWQSTAVDRTATTRLVPPVFSAGSSSFLNSSAGGNQSNQQKPGQENIPAPLAVFPGVAAKARSHPVSVAAPPRRESISPLTTSYLHTFA